jgi:nucleotide-binding universal stress UspA family protein
LAYTLKAQCVVLGSMAHTGISDRLVGNTAEKVIHYTKTDLLVVSR